MSRQSDIFNYNFFFWKVFGLWGGRTPKKYYKYYSILYIAITFILFNILLTINLAYTPPKIEAIIREVLFYFAEIAIMSKVFMIIFMRDKILKAFKIIDCAELAGDDEASRQIINENNAKYKKFFKFSTIFLHIGYSAKVFIPISLHILFHRKRELPISMYYFLTDDLRDRYFILWFVYQAYSIYGHMMYTITIDTFVGGLLINAIAQVQVLRHKLMNLKLDDNELKLTHDTQDEIQMVRLRKYLLRYEIILEYCDLIQEIITVTMFIVFGLSTLIICVVLCAFFLPLTTEIFVFMVIYMFAMTLQIFIPGFLGTQLNYESRELMFAAYCTEWVPRSEPFKRSLIIFIGRANRPIQMTALQMFPLSLTTVISIIKAAYSFFTLISSFKDA